MPDPIKPVNNANTQLFNASPETLAKQIVAKMGSLFDQDYSYTQMGYEKEGIMTHRPDNAYIENEDGSVKEHLYYGQKHKDGQIDPNEYNSVARHDSNDDEMTRLDIRLRENRVTGKNKPIDVTDRKLKSFVLRGGWDQFRDVLGNGKMMYTSYQDAGYALDDAQRQGEDREKLREKFVKNLGNEEGVITYDTALRAVSSMSKKEQEALASDLGVEFEAPPAVPDEKDKKLAEMQKQLEDLKKANETKDKELEGAKKENSKLKGKLNANAGSLIIGGKKYKELGRKVYIEEEPKK